MLVVGQAAQHRERGGALVPPRPSQPTLHVIKPHSRRSLCAPTRVRRRVVTLSLCHTTQF